MDHGWAVYDGSGSLSTVSGAGRPGRVLRASTSQGTSFGIKYPASGSLDLPLRQVSVWIKDSNTFYFYVRVHATNGSDYYIRYDPSDGSPYPSGSNAMVPVGTQYRDGTWRELKRDLDADLRAVFGVGVESVLWFCIRGDYDLDDVQLVQERVSYFAGGQRVALREGGELYWLPSDHLGSTAVTANADGTKRAELRYKAWGENRYTWKETPTARRFTGQVEDGTIGLYFYNARYYDPCLGRFVQADTIVPEPENPQSLNRYAYVNNSVLNYVDPSGHSCASPMDVHEKSMCGDLEQQMLDSTVRVHLWGYKIVWEKLPDGSFVEIRVTLHTEGIGTIVGEHILYSHNHFRVLLEEELHLSSIELRDVNNNVLASPSWMRYETTGKLGVLEFSEDEVDLGPAAEVGYPFELREGSEIGQLIQDREDPLKTEVQWVEFSAWKEPNRTYYTTGSVIPSDSGGGNFYRGSWVGSTHSRSPSTVAVFPLDVNRR